MGKPSSSLKKKKRSKISSHARIKKRSKSRTRRSNKLKKLRRHNDSVSYSSDTDNSRSSVSMSSSSPEDDYISKRSRSRKQKYVKGSKKRVRRRSSSSESIEGSPCVRKRKGSMKNDDFRVKKKRHEKKKSGRDVSVSSAGSESRSCSTCHSSSDESEIEKTRGKSERKYKDMRRPEKLKKESKWGISRLRSSSSFSQFADCGDHQIKNSLAANANSRRLRSVITVVREGEDMTGMFNDEYKEEMVYDHDDYPSSRSNDSNDGGSKRELVHNSCVGSEERKYAEDEKGEAFSNIRTFKVTESDKDIEGHDGSNHCCDGFEITDDVKEKKNQDSGVVDSKSGYDLELILRQKALENLRNRRGHQADAKNPVNEKVVISFEVNALTPISGSSQHGFSKGEGARVIGASDVSKCSGISTDLSLNDEISERNSSGKGSESAEHDVQHPPGLLACPGKPKERRISVPRSSGTNIPRSVVLASKPELSSTCTMNKPSRTFQGPPQAKTITRNHVDKSMVGIMPTVNPLGGNGTTEEMNNDSASGDPSSCLKSPFEDNGSNKLQDEANEGSQYQQKTMTVMRGGEMVEVSYKVYIPKKAPALARRQLKR